MTSRFLASVLIAFGIAGVSIAQFPSQRPSDPGPLVPSGVANISLAPGYRLTFLFDLTASIGAAADMVTGPSGDLFFTAASGTACGLPAATNVYRVAMMGDQPMTPLSVIPTLSTAIDAHQIVYDPASGFMFATGTCDQTQFVYRLPGNGMAQIMNPTIPLNDPDGLALGFLPGSTD